MISGIFGEYSPRISKNGDGEGDPLCLSFGDTSGTGIIQKVALQEMWHPKINPQIANYHKPIVSLRKKKKVGA